MSLFSLYSTVFFVKPKSLFAFKADIAHHSEALKTTLTDLSLSDFAINISAILSL